MLKESGDLIRAMLKGTLLGYQLRHGKQDSFSKKLFVI